MFTAVRPEAQKRLSCTPPVGLRQARREHQRPGDVRALVADGRDDAEHHVIDPLGIQVRVALLECIHQADEQRQGLGAVQRALLALAARGANGVEDEGFLAHGEPPWETVEWVYRERATSSFMISFAPARIRSTRVSANRWAMGYSFMYP